MVLDAIQYIVWNNFLLLSVMVFYGQRMLFSNYKLWQKRRQFKGNVPSPPMDSFLYGHIATMQAHQADNTFMDLWKRWFDEYGKTLILFSGGRHIFMTVEPELFKLFATDLTHFQKSEKLPSRSLFGEKIVGYNSILSGSGHKWAKKRTIMSKYFAKTNMGDIFELCKPVAVNRIANMLKDEVGSGKVIELHKELSRIFYSYPEVLGISGFDTPEAIGKIFDTILEMIPKQLTNTGLRKYFYGVSQERIYTANMLKDMRARLKVLVQEKLRATSAEKVEKVLRGGGKQKVETGKSFDKVETDSCDPTDMLGYLALANSSVFKKGPDRVLSIVEDIVTVYFVMDNMVEQITALFLDLAKNPEVYQKMAAEIRGFELRDISSMEELKYTDCVMNESLRLTPALLRGTRGFDFKAVNSYNKTDGTGYMKMGPYNIPTDTTRGFSAAYCQYLLHRDVEYWEEPLKFKPERWENGFKPAPFTYLPFFSGARGCLGKNYALMAMKLTLVVLLQNFELTPKFDTKKPPVVDQTHATMRILNNVDFEFVPL